MALEVVIVVSVISCLGVRVVSWMDLLGGSHGFGGVDAAASRDLPIK